MPTGQFRRVGIIAGMPAELAAFLPVGPRSTITLGGLAAERIVDGDREIFLLSAGIGKVAAATAAVLLHARFGVELLAVIGTAGNIGDGDGGVFNIAAAFQADFGAQRASGLTHYTAGTLPIGAAQIEAFKALWIPGLDLQTARIATSDLFVECGIHAARVRNALDVSLIDMETAAVAQAAALLGIPWIAIKATTDAADGGSADAFAANLAAAARASAAAMERALLLL